MADSISAAVAVLTLSGIVWSWYIKTVISNSVAPLKVSIDDLNKTISRIDQNQLKYQADLEALQRSVFEISKATGILERDVKRAHERVDRSEQRINDIEKYIYGKN